MVSVAVASDGYQKMSAQQKGLDSIDPAPEVDSHSLCRSLALSREPELVKNRVDAEALALHPETESLGKSS